VKLLTDLFRRLARARVWVILQFGLTLLLLLVGAAWTRLPERYAWQVALTLLVPVLLAISILELEAGTIRKLAGDDGPRVKLVWGAISLLVWIALWCAAWWLLDWCDDRIWNWASYLNSKAGPHARSAVFSFAHISRDLTILEWILRWIAIPAKLIPFAAASALWALRLRWKRTFRLLWNWRWWAGVIVAALVGVYAPSRFFTGTPHGTVSAQEGTVALKLAAAYILAIGSWVFTLAWWATLFFRGTRPPEEEVMVAVPVLTGPPDRNLKAKADIPSEPEEAS
jgi:hypothetical protein